MPSTVATEIGALHEYAGNLHMHTPYSDGEGSHAHIAAEARKAGLDFVIVTDHNVWVSDIEGYYGDKKNGYVLLLTGEEIHDRTRLPQVNHLLVYGANCELAPHSGNPQGLIDTANKAGGLAFLAHPDDVDFLPLHEPSIAWVDRQVTGFAGLEIWNFMSSLKSALNFKPRTVLRALFRPEELVLAPDPKTLSYWDSLLMQGRQVVAIGNSDAHATVVKLGPLRHTVYPYDFLFSCINTHLLTTAPLSGRWREDARLLYAALRDGRAFVAYDLLGKARGFRFSARGEHGTAVMGQRLRLGSGVTLQAFCNESAVFRLVYNGKTVAETAGRENLIFNAKQPGAYRVEVRKQYNGQQRLWILSNPIYLQG
jgi:PHP domain